MKLREVEGNIVGLHVRTDKKIMEIKSGWHMGLWLKKPNDNSDRIYPYFEPDFLDLEVVNRPKAKKA